jgi:hypothetical protein
MFAFLQLSDEEIKEDEDTYPNIGYKIIFIKIKNYLYKLKYYSIIIIKIGRAARPVFLAPNRQEAHRRNRPSCAKMLRRLCVDKCPQ